MGHGGMGGTSPRRGWTLVAVACILLVSTAEAVHGTQELSAGEPSDAPPGAFGGEDTSLGESNDDTYPDNGVANTEAEQNAELQERRDEREVQMEDADTDRGELGETSTPEPKSGQAAAADENGNSNEQGPHPQGGDNEKGDQEDGGSKSESDGAESEPAPVQEGKFSQNVVIKAGKETLRVGEAWSMPGLYSSDGAPRDLILGTAAGKRVYFGTAKNDAWIQATTGHMWLKGSITIKNYAHFFAEKQRLRVGAAWGMPGLYASDNADRDMIIGTAAGKKIFFGVNRQDAWIEAGEGRMWLRGSLIVQSYGHFVAEGQRLRVGSVFGMPGLYASDGADRDMVIGTAAGKKIYFGLKQQDASIEAGTGNMFLKGSLETNQNSFFKSEGKTLEVGSQNGMPGIFSGKSGANDISIG